MKEIRADLIRKKYISLLGVIIGGIVLLYGLLGDPGPDGTRFPFYSRIILSAAFFALLDLIRYSDQSRNDKTTKKAYLLEKDERIEYVNGTVGLPMIQVTSTLMVFFGLFIRRWDMVASDALMYGAVIQYVLVRGLKYIKLRRMSSDRGGEGNGRL